MTPATPTTTVTDPREQLRSWLRILLRRTALLHVASGALSFLAVAAWLGVVLMLWSRGENHSAATVTAVGRGVVVVLFGLFAWFVVWPLIRMPRLNQLAGEIEQRRDLRELLRAGFEFSSDTEAARRYSPELVGEVIRQAVSSVEGLQVRFLFLTRRDLALVPVAYGGLFVLLLVALFTPASLTRAGRVVVAPSTVAAADHRANIHARPGNITVLAGSDVTITGLDLGRSEDAVEISFRVTEDFWKTEPTQRTERQDAHVDGDLRFDRYEYTFRDIRHTVSYYFKSAEERSPTYTITVVHEPILTDLKIRLTPPSYTGEKPVDLIDNGGNIQALEGTDVQVVATSNNPLRSAEVSFNSGKPITTAVSGREVRFGFAALEDGEYSVSLHDSLGFTTRDPLVYSIEVFQDNPPTLEVLQPGGDTILPRNRQLELGFIAADDYGVRSASIFHRKTGETEFARLNIPMGADRDRKDVAIAHRWDLGDVQLFPGKAIEYFVQVADNNVVTGPGVAKSRLFQISVPTMAELYERAREEETSRTDKMAEAIEDSKEFRERLEKIRREFIKTEQMEWSQKKDVDRALEQQKQVDEKLSEVRQSLDNTLKELAENEMTSQEIGEKMEEIRELLEEIDNEELRKHMEELRKAMEKMDAEQIKKALENLDVDTEKMLEKLERTAELLKQIAREQKMEEMVRNSRDLMDEQQELNKETSESNSENAEQMGELSEKQKELAEQAKQLQEKMQEFSEANAKEEPQTSQQMQQMSEQMKKDGPQQNMKKASDQLSQQQKSQAQQEQQEAMDKMISLFQQLQKGQQQMQQNQGQRMAMNLSKFARQTLELSQKQETLSRELQGDQRTDDDPADTQQIAQDQMSYLRATERVADSIMKMAGQSLAIPPSLMEALGRAAERMQNSVLFLEQNKPFMSTAHANNAVEALNEATIEMLRSAQQCSQGGSSSGSQSMAQQMMQQLIPRQQDVLQQTQEMMEMQAMSERLRQERQAQIERLAGQQRSLKDVAEQMQRAMKEDKEFLGRLDRTIEDMEAVVEALESGEINQDLVNKEQRILSRLLDASRSIHTRDYEKERESMTADEIFSRSLGGANGESMSQSLREEIRRAMQLKAPGEFEDLIKLYFRALAEESAVSPGTGAN